MRPAIQELEKYREANGRFPRSQAELETALQCDKSLVDSLLATELTYSTELWRGTHVRYYEIDSGFMLHFNHNCFCDFPDTSRYQYGSWDDSWGTWCD